jgi:Flp pilus assembly protein TadD
MARLNNGDVADAADTLQKAVLMDPNNAEAWVNLASCLATLQRHDEALKAALRAAELDPGLADAHNNLGVIAQAQDRDAEALEHFRKAMEADPGNVRYHLNLASLYEKMGRTEEAIREYEIFVRDWRGNLAAAEDARGRLERLRKK